MLEVILTLPAILLVFLLPGLSLARVFHLEFVNLAETLFYSISLSLAAIVAIGFALGSTIGINLVTVLGAFILVGAAGLVPIVLRSRSALSKGREIWPYVITHVKRIPSKFSLLAIAAIAVTALNWSSAIGTHPVDMGEHVFWAKTIMATSRLPVYSSVEPLDQAVKFTYGAHLVLAQFFLLAGVPIEDYSWIPTLIGSVGLWTGIALLAIRITRSKWAGAIAAMMYGTAIQPGGYIERGNLPDIAGYLLLVSTLYSILRVRNNKSFSYPLGLALVSVIPYHQLATVILPIVLLITIGFSYLRARSELVETLRAVFTGQTRLAFWVAMVLLAVVYAGTVTYVSGSAVSQLATGNWRPYVAPLFDDFTVPGAALGALAAAGLATIVTRRTVGHLLPVAWAASLVFLANALVIGIPIPDPGRFLWRLTEPFSILAAIFTYSAVRALKTRVDTFSAGRIIRVRRNWILVASVLLVVALVIVQVAGISSFSSRYKPVEVFYQDDKRIGQWLAVNASSTVVTANDLDVDQTATWIQPYSMKLHFIYRADFGAIVAPAHYIQIYESMKILYESPSDLRVPQIIQAFNLTYVVAHTDEIRLFSASPFFDSTPVFQTGESALFKTKVG